MNTKKDYKSKGLEKTWHIHANLKIHRHVHNDAEEELHFDFIKIVNPLHDLDTSTFKIDGYQSFSIWKLVIALISFVSCLCLTYVGGIDQITQTWALFSISTITLLTVGIEYYVASYFAIKNKNITEDILVAFSITVTYVYSTVVVFYFGNLDYSLFSLVGEIVGLMYAGKALEGYLSKKTTNELTLLSNLFSNEAILFNDKKEKIIDPNEIKKGDLILVKMGSKIPIDGIIVSGETTTNDSAFTGESIPISKLTGSSVFCGTISLTGTIVIKASGSVKDTMVNKIINGINEASQSKPKTQRIADKISKWFVPSVILVTIITLLSWGFSTNDWNESFNTAITILIVACPSSFALVAPLSILVSTVVGGSKGIHFNSKKVFENTSGIDVVCFDKTGTLTDGMLSIVKTNIPSKLLKMIGFVEHKSIHPIAKPIANKYNKGFTDESSLKYKEIVGKGFEIQYEKRKYLLGSLKWMKEKNDLIIPNEISKYIDNGNIVVYLYSIDAKKIIGFIAMEDKVKKESKGVIKQLLKNNIKPIMITGDGERVSHNIGKQLGIPLENIFAEQSPVEKSDLIKSFKKQGNKVAFIGDGINDSIVLKESDLSIAMGSGSDVAKESSDIVIMNNNLSLVLEALGLSELTNKTIYRGFIFSLLYNGILIPISMAGIITPLLGISLQFVSEIFTVLNAVILIRYKNKDSFKRK